MLKKVLTGILLFWIIKLSLLLLFRKYLALDYDSFYLVHRIGLRINFILVLIIISIWDRKQSYVHVILTNIFTLLGIQAVTWLIVFVDVFILGVESYDLSRMRPGFKMIVLSIFISVIIASIIKFSSFIISKNIATKHENPTL